jgi:iron complex outermembrane receptor protein
MRLRHAGAAVMFCVAALPAPALATDGPSVFDLDINQLMQLPVVTASRHREALDRAPAIISVLEGEDLRRRGYRSVADALTQVPGFYVASDGVGQYVMVRGVDSGQRAYGRTLKVMLDGQPLGQRSDASQFLGPELIPLGVVDRIEVVRGPASALYGADAYLGVINIITRGDVPAASIGLSAGAMAGAGPSVGTEALSSLQQGRWSALLTAALARENHSGLRLPASSPAAAGFSDPEARDAISQPGSAYARLRYRGEAQRHTLSLHASEIASDAQFLDFGTLSPDNRVALQQQTLGWLSEWDRGDSQHYQLRLAHAWGGPSPDERLSLGQAGSYPQRDFGYRDNDFGFEGQFSQGLHHVVAGADGSWDEESPFDVYSINTGSGAATLLSPAQSGQLFRDLGAYLQYQWLPDGGWSPSLNWRHDSSNRYGEHNSYRVGLSRDLGTHLSGKLLYGTSFKAPNAFELYAQPVYTGDILGNPDLVPETASSTDVQLLWQMSDALLVTATVYHMTVRNLIELEPFGINQRWTNRGTQEGNGVETEWRWRSGPQELVLVTSWQDATVKLQQPLTPEVTVPTAAAPRLLATGQYRYRLDDREFGVESHYATERRASDSNISVNLNRAYVLPPYAVWRLHAMQQWGAHRLTLALDNVFDRHYTEAGYGGIDLPSLRRTLWLSWTWQQEAAR